MILRKFRLMPLCTKIRIKKEKPRINAKKHEKRVNKFSVISCYLVVIFLSAFLLLLCKAALRIDHILQTRVPVSQIDSAFEDGFQIRHIKRPAFAAFDVIILLVFVLFLRHHLC